MFRYLSLWSGPKPCFHLSKILTASFLILKKTFVIVSVIFNQCSISSLFTLRSTCLVFLAKQCPSVACMPIFLMSLGLCMCWQLYLQYLLSFLDTGILIHSSGFSVTQSTCFLELQSHSHVCLRYSMHLMVLQLCLLIFVTHWVVLSARAKIVPFYFTFFPNYLTQRPKNRSRLYTQAHPLTALIFNFNFYFW